MIWYNREYLKNEENLKAIFEYIWNYEIGDYIPSRDYYKGEELESIKKIGLIDEYLIKIYESWNNLGVIKIDENTIIYIFD